MSLSFHNIEIKQESKEISEFSYYNSSLTSLHVATGKKDLIALLSNGYDWSKVEEKIFLKIIKSRIGLKKHFSIPTPAEILKTCDYGQYKNKMLLFIFSKVSNGILSAIYFFHELDVIPFDQLNNQEKIYLSYSFYYCLNHVCTKEDIKSFIDAATLLKKKAGISFFYLLFKNPVSEKSQSCISYFINVCQLIINIKKTDIENIIKKHFPNLIELIKALEIIYSSEKNLGNPEEKWDRLFEKFLKTDDFVRFPLSLEEVNQLKKEYEKVNKETKSLHSLSPVELAKEAKISALKIKTYPDQLFRLVAIVREAMAQEFKNYPYPEQMLSVLALLKKPAELKGRVAKIRTGEGKSRILAMLAAIGALQNQCVDIITSNRYLAIRDQKLFSNFYRMLGITSSHICRDKPEKQFFDHLILYTTHHDIEFSILWDKIYDTQFRKTTVNGTLIERPFQQVWVDEVDVMLLDAQRNSARIAIEHTESFSWVYHPIIHFIKKKAEKDKLSTEEIAAFKAQVNTFEMLKEFKTLLKETAPSHITEKEFTDTQLLKWLRSGIRALYELEFDRDYTIKNVTTYTARGYIEIPQIVIIDAETTGRASGENCRWMNGTHEILEIIHKIPPGYESLTCAAISHMSLLNQYDTIGGLTGTVGSEVEREELLEIYQVGSFDVPPRFPNRRIEEKPLYFATHEAYIKAMVDEIKHITSQGRPVLIILMTISETIYFASKLKSFDITAKVINEKQIEDEEYLISKAGNPGSITVATYTAGRGTDIICNEEALKNGGLHVMFGTFPNNERPEEQGFGRAGRQGQPGSCRMFILESDKYIQTLLKNNFPEEKTVSLANDEKAIEKLKVFRHKAVELESKQRRLFARLDTCQYKVLQEFWRLLDYFRKALASIDIDKLTEACHKISPVMEMSIFSNEHKYTSSPIREIARKSVIKDGIEIEEVYSEQHVIIESDALPFWLKKLNEQADILVKQHFNKIIVDWRTFIEKFKNQFLETALKTWATFYTNLVDDFSAHPILFEKMLYKKIHQVMNSDLSFAFHNPSQQFLLFLGTILKHNAHDILLKNDLLEKSDSLEKSHFFKEWEKRIKSMYEPSDDLRIVIKGITTFQKKDDIYFPLNPPPSPTLFL